MSAAFQPTRWTLLQKAAGADHATRERAWEDLYASYRAPLIVFARMRIQVFEVLQSQLAGADEESLRDRAPAMGMAKGALRVALHRLRDRFREILRAEVRETLPPNADVKEEIRYLIQIL